MTQTIILTIRGNGNLRGTFNNLPVNIATLAPAGIGTKTFTNVPIGVTQVNLRLTAISGASCSLTITNDGKIIHKSAANRLTSPLLSPTIDIESTIIVPEPVIEIVEPEVEIEPQPTIIDQIPIQLPTDSNVAPEAGIQNEHDVNFQEAFVPEEFGSAPEISIDDMISDPIDETVLFGELDVSVPPPVITGERVSPTEFTPAEKAQGLGFPLILLLLAGQL